MLDDWIIQHLNPLRNESLVLVADPQRMIRAGAQAVDGWAKESGFTVLFCSGNLALREMYENLRDDSNAKVILVDRSREKAKVPLFYPDLEARCKPKARLVFTLRDFLVEATGDTKWPSLVNNDRNLSRLILENLNESLAAHRQLRDVDDHRFQDSDLYKIVLGATLGINPFKKLSPGEIRRLCIEHHDRLENIKNLFMGNASDEVNDGLNHLKEQITKADKPWCWMLDNDPQTVVRAFTLAAIMHQHGLEYEILLANFDTRLERFKNIPKKSVNDAIKDMLKANPDQVAEDVALVESFLREEPNSRIAFLLADRCKLDVPEEAKKVLLSEKLSPLVRSMAMLSLLIDLLTHRKIAFHKEIIKNVWDEENGKASSTSVAMRRPTPQWSTLLDAYNRAIQLLEISDHLNGEARKLKVVPTKDLTFEQFDKLWNKDHANRLDYYTSGLRRLLLVGDILPISKTDFWPQLASRWETVQKKFTEYVNAIDRDLEMVNSRFQDLYLAHYTEWIKQPDSPVIFTHQFIPRVLKTNWDPQSGKKAIILIFDGLRVDAWEGLVRPILEEKYDVEKSFAGSAILPSETQLSRKAISAGCLPIEFTSTTENVLLEGALSKHLGLTIKFKVEKQDDTVESGISARYISPQLDMVIFNFTDKKLHNNKDDLSFIYDTVVRETLRQDVRSILRELPNDATIFILSDHGFTPVPQPEFLVPNNVVTDSSDVKYRVARLKTPLNTEDAKKAIQFKASEMGISDKIKRATGGWSFNHIMFPRPGLTLRRHQGKHDPERYTHGGLSLAECMIPIAVLLPKVKYEPLFDFEELKFLGSLAEGQPLEVVVVAKAKSRVSDEVLFQLLFETEFEELQPRKEFFSGTEQQYSLRWTPKVDNPTLEEQTRGYVTRQFTAVAIYRSNNRTIRSTVHGSVNIQLDSTRIRRRLDPRLDGIMGMVPAALR